MDNKKLINIFIVVLALFFLLATVVFFLLRPSQEPEEEVVGRDGLPVIGPSEGGVGSFAPESSRDDFTRTGFGGLFGSDFDDIDFSGSEEGYFLVKLFDSPVAGFSLSEGGDGLKVRLIERSSGNVYDINNLKESPRVTRITNTLIPQTHYANISGEYVFIEFYNNSSDEFDTIVGKITSESQIPSEITGTTVGKIDWATRGSRDDGKFFYLISSDESTDGIVFDVENNTRTRIFSSPFSSWIPFYSQNGKIGMLTKPTETLEGDFILYDTPRGESKTLFSETGLSVMPDKEIDSFVFSYVDFSSIVSGIASVSSATQTTFDFETYADKCAIASESVICGVPISISSSNPNLIILDSWYQGLISFDDFFMLFERESGISNIIYLPSGEDEIIDVYEPQISADSTAFIFKNKNDESLWGLIYREGDEAEESEDS